MLMAVQGDNDPVDVVEIGEQTGVMGAVYKASPPCCFFHVLAKHDLVEAAMHTQRLIAVQSAAMAAISILIMPYC